MTQPPVSYKRHRFPPQIIAHAVWLYFTFPLSLRLVEEMLLERGIVGPTPKSGEFSRAIDNGGRDRRAEPGARGAIRRGDVALRHHALDHAGLALCRRSAAQRARRQSALLQRDGGVPLWLPGQRDTMAATVGAGAIEVEERIVLRRLEVAGLPRDAWWNAQRAAREASVARNRVATARDIGADMTRRVEFGDAAQSDALLARNELLDLRTPIAALRRAEAQAQLVEATPIDSPDVAVFGRQEHNRQYSTDPSQQVTISARTPPRSACAAHPFADRRPPGAATGGGARGATRGSSDFSWAYSPQPSTNAEMAI